MKTKTVRQDSHSRLMVPAAIFCVIYLILYGQLMTDFFLFIDDEIYFTNNPYIKSLDFDNIIRMFTKYYEGNYHPVTSLLEAVEYALFGLQPRAFHLVSFFFHFINCVLVFRLIRKISDKAEIASVVTFVFAFHPMRVENVGWITDQTDIFMGFFALFSLNLYHRFIQQGRYSFYWLSLFFFLLALGSKPAAIAIPPLLFLFDYLAGKQLLQKLWLKLPFFTLAIACAAVTILSLDARVRIQAFLLPEYSIPEKFLVANYTLAYYLVSFLFPLKLSLLHLAEKPLSWMYYAAPLLNMMVLYGIYMVYKKDKLIPAGMLFFLFTIALVLQVIPSGFNIVADRYTYLPYIGLTVALAALIYNNAGGGLPSFIRNNRSTVLGLFGMIYLALHFNYGKKWTSLTELSLHTAEHNPHSPYTWVMAANYALANNAMPDAREYLNQAEMADPKNPDLYFMRGKIDYLERNLASSLKNLQQAQQLRCTRPDMNELLALLYFENNQFDSAGAYFSKVISTDSAFVPANYRNRAICYFSLGQFREAIRDYDSLLAHDPSMANMYGERGICHGRLGNRQQACEDISRALAAGFEDFRSDFNQYCQTPGN